MLTLLGFAALACGLISLGILAADRLAPAQTLALAFPASRPSPTPGPWRDSRGRWRCPHTNRFVKAPR